jgi:hypothetical protein
MTSKNIGKHLPLDHHARMLKSLLELESAFWALRDDAQKMPVQSQINTSLDSIHRAMLKLKSGLENKLFSDWPDRTDFGFPHYGNDPKPREGARALLAYLDESQGRNT